MTDGAGDLRLWGYGNHVAGAADAGALVGRVVQVDRGECDVVTADGMVRAGSDSVRAQAEVAPVTGDWVQVRWQDGVALMSRVLPRRTALTRRDPAERDAEQVLAANFDTVGIVAGLDRPLPPGRFERMLVMARDSGAGIVILLTKADRATDAAAAASTVRAVAGDVTVLTLSVRSGAGIDDLRSRLGPGHTLALVGASGSGKSSLVNALAGADVAATAAVRYSDRRGRHTTIARRLVLLPGDGGMVLDTPGVRALGLTDAQEALRRVFSDIENHGSRCRFADCAHGAEPDCAVSAAVESGEMDARRVERFLALRDEIEQQRIREETRARSRRRR
ncbi:MAG: ribosome small subunit-dependent GTPase A [Acidimicrobiaceae bacterium]|nr:ribosome small subunit-dependent GTPase A [Acidimicrobiaceae bacterium]MYA14581.1 ribosome small subunit-dependent GTPase A [Acidimicrobiaceae bacterium]MYE66096.1 ribosome small subunit-dependent GTPase A [Acidimicrobiaceae bacterium]